MIGRAFTTFALVLFAAVSLRAADVVVLKGGTRIELKQPWVQQGNNALLTRTDGTLLSVPVSEIDMKATAAARKAPPPKPAPAFAAPPESPAQAARSVREGPQARVKITDSDVGHAAPAEAEEKPGGITNSRLEVADFSHETSGGNLVLRGMLRNVGSTTATQAKLLVAVLDDQGKTIGSGSATLSGPTIEAGNAVAFTGMVPVGEKIVGNVKFTPQWSEPPPPTPVGGPAAASAASAGGPGQSANAAPRPVPTPYGRGSLWAPAAPPAGSTPPPDGKNGYLPGAARPEDQPKPPQ
ncbi:MAG TPA: FxLYD domain-containing protein [Thermoanaerobaculia bacterium]